METPSDCSYVPERDAWLSKGVATESEGDAALSPFECGQGEANIAVSQAARW